jgi:hypothetical protein
MQTDWGGEYEKLNSFFQKVGITHHVSCPHAHQQNGSAERKYRHIVKVGLALLANASMSLKFWDEAFLTATFLINLLPSKVINHDTPIERLLHSKPNYESLRIFGCACWPNLRPYNMRKLSFRSTRCVFLGFSPRHKGVKCLDVSTGHVYISHDVVFDETIFPFAELHPNASRRLKQDILLLPQHPSNSGDANIDDYMPLTVVPIVTHNDGEDPADTHHGADTIVEEQESARNSGLHAPESEQIDPTLNARGGDLEGDSPTSTRTNPEEDLVRFGRAGPPDDEVPDETSLTRSPCVDESRPNTSPSSRSRSPSPVHVTLMRHNAVGPASSSCNHELDSPDGADPEAGSPVLSPQRDEVDQHFSPGHSSELDAPPSASPTPPLPPAPHTRLQKGIRQPK